MSGAGTDALAGLDLAWFDQIILLVASLAANFLSALSGGGLLTDDLLELRVKGALPRMEALKRVADEHGVNFMATICAICKAQFSKVLPYYGFDMSMVGGVHQLVSKAIRLGDQR